MKLATIEDTRSARGLRPAIAALALSSYARLQASQLDIRPARC